MSRLATTRTLNGASDRAPAASLAGFLARHDRLFVLTGAGVSTGSGIPDYRDREGGWKGAAPIQHDAFVNRFSRRKRYWARSMAGWPPVARAAPNTAHWMLARLEAQGRMSALVTQNVDGLHQAAGSQNVIDLHGRLDRVVCLDCGAPVSRHRVQHWLIDANAGWLQDANALRPDGDIELGDVDYEGFSVPGCAACAGVLKPDVVFFGGAVPAERVACAWQALEAADAVLVAGSSLTVWSGFRFIRAAAQRGLPIMLVNAGRTRADHLVDYKIDADCGRMLAAALAPA